MELHLQKASPESQAYHLHDTVAFPPFQTLTPPTKSQTRTAYFSASERATTGKKIEITRQCPLTGYDRMRHSPVAVSPTQLFFLPRLARNTLTIRYPTITLLIQSVMSFRAVTSSSMLYSCHGMNEPTTTSER